MGKKAKPIATKEFDEKFERGEDVSEQIEWSKATKRVALDLTPDTIRELDTEAARVGVPRQALIKLWIRDRLDQLKASQKRAG